MSPRVGGAKRSSPGPVKVEVPISPPAMSFFRENFTAPLRVMDGDMAIMTPGVGFFFLVITAMRLECDRNHLPGLAVRGQPIAN